MFEVKRIADIAADSFLAGIFADAVFDAISGKSGMRKRRGKIAPMTPRRFSQSPLRLGFGAGTREDFERYFLVISNFSFALQ
jgi:hypothetical protein